jgi:hypothetical protein
VRLKGVLVIPALFACASAQQPALCTVTIPVTMVSKTGARVQRELTAEQLRVRVDRRDVETKVYPAQSGRIVLVVDHSASMDDQWPVVRRIVNEVLQKAPPRLPVALYAFEEKVFFAPTREQIPVVLDSIERQPPHPRGTRLFGTIARVMAELILSPGDLVLVVTDGGDNVGQVREKELRKTLETSGVRLSVILVIKRNTPEEMTAPAKMEELTSRTGGALYILPEYVRANDPNVLGPDFVDRLINYYRVKVEIPVSDKLQSLKVDLRDKKNLSAVLWSPAKLPACDANTLERAP